MRNPGQRPAAICTVTRGGRQARQGLGCILGVLLGGALAGCQGLPRETPQATAKPGDGLVRVGKTVVTLVKPFRQGEPNGLFDGVI
ncbi:MAG: hypothetical protein ACK549_07050, partial [Cyanobacteriota bacterium]